MIIMGVDPGTRATGFGVISVQGNRCACLDFGAIKPRRGEAPLQIGERLRYIHQELVTLIQNYQPEILAVEGVFHAVNVRSALTLGHARGVILLAAAQHGVELVEYSPLEVKKAVVGYGRADKAQVQMMVQRLLNMKVKPQPHDAADALAIALCQAFSSRFHQAVKRNSGISPYLET
ncbi:MAG TPA: crossover junction endodeoxyribonuclease RuvC [Acidobacteriota bacterium]|nr:crossover junction endodeoxyribonuclease RuvC [Acidobacteriota bacterium]